MKSLAGSVVFRVGGARWVLLPLAVTILCAVMAGTALAGWGHHGSGGYGHPRTYIGTYVPWGSYWYGGPNAYWGPYGYRPHRVYKRIYRIYNPRSRW